MMKKLPMFCVVWLYFIVSSSAFSAPVLDVMDPSISVNASKPRNYITVQNIGDSAGMFTVSVKNITDPTHPILYTNSQLKTLPVFIKPILIRKFRAGQKKRITLIRNPKASLAKPMVLELAIKEYIAPTKGQDVSPSDTGIQVKGSIVSRAKVTVS
ncbi:hypothetical protein M9194_04190 [Vibrio sp. S4M6]|uniref:hypothetical protein n=1 Tax=Vibrio sinus TaxID=2946865 RepID=UPI002029DD52|nr:hypothetical protein [Vibrio sinus]MCL9780635.1 hypothetical protein [Vibrio sinus]